LTTLSERERLVLGAVIETYVQTAEPAASRTIAKRFGLGLSAATIRNTMSDLEEKGYLYHPHTSAGRIPTDRAYRMYVDALMHPSELTRDEAHQIREELGRRNAVDQILARAAQVLSVLTQELGVAIGPSLDEAVLERLDLVQVASDRLLLALTLKHGAVRTIFVEVPSHMVAEAVTQVAMVLNERLSGLTLKDIRLTLPDRVRDATSNPESIELLNIFVQEAEELFDVPATAGGDPLGGGVLLSSAQLLAGQPEFATAARLQGLLGVTERRDRLREALAERTSPGLTITIGSEHQDPNLSAFTLVTSSYRAGPLAGVIGVLGPTRMPYEKVVALVDHTSRLVEELMQ
jgi:heat-inducible transcriptional repressor